MNLLELHEALHKFMKEHPEAWDMEVFQTSCFDDPYRFLTSGLYVGEVHTVVEEDEE